MAIICEIESATEQERRHFAMGWQCPECYGVRVKITKDRFDARARYDRFTCEECGCQWTPDMFDVERSDSNVD